MLEMIEYVEIVLGVGMNEIDHREERDDHPHATPAPLVIVARGNAIVITAWSQPTGGDLAFLAAMAFYVDGTHAYPKKK